MASFRVVRVLPGCNSPSYGLDGVTAGDRGLFLLLSASFPTWPYNSGHRSHRPPSSPSSPLALQHVRGRQGSLHPLAAHGPRRWELGYVLREAWAASEYDHRSCCWCPRPSSLVHVGDFIAGGFSKFATLPLDLCKKRMQMNMASGNGVFQVTSGRSYGVG